jgi:hypothetical protein
MDCLSAKFSHVTCNVTRQSQIVGSSFLTSFVYIAIMLWLSTSLLTTAFSF